MDWLQLEEKDRLLLKEMNNFSNFKIHNLS